MVKAIIIVAVVLAIFVGGNYAFDVQRFLTDIETVQSFDLLELLSTAWTSPVPEYDGGTILEGILNSTPLRAVYAFVYRVNVTFATLGAFACWVLNTSSLMQPWNYAKPITPFNWGAYA